MISDDGRFVAFNSQASDLVTNDTNGGGSFGTDVFVRDLQAATAMLVTVNSAGTGSGNLGSFASNVRISGNGQYVVFQSSATNLVGGINYRGNSSNVFVRDIVAKSTRVVNLNLSGTATGNSRALYPSISSDGHFVAFMSDANDLVPNDNNNGIGGGRIDDVFVRDMQSNVTTLVSMNRAGTDSGNSSSFAPLISADGRFVLFASVATNLTVVDDFNASQDLFSRDFQTNNTTLISIDRFGRAGGLTSAYLQNSNGRVVIFSSPNNNFVTNDHNGLSDVFAYHSADPASSTMTFSAAHYEAEEGNGSVTLRVTRSGDITLDASVDVATNETAGFLPCATVDGIPSQRCDYLTAGGTLRFAAGDNSKTLEILLYDDAYVEGPETLTLTLSNPSVGTVGTPATTTLTIRDNDTAPPTSNPLDNADARFFVRQHYYDFLNRLPDAGGLDYWSERITECGSDPLCIHRRRVVVSNAFFYEQEFQQTGAYVYRLYRAAFGNDQPSPNPDTGNPSESKKIPAYDVFVQDRARVVAGANQAQAQLDLANAFVQRPQFLARYPTGLSGPEYVDALLTRIKDDSGADLTSERNALISLFNQSGRSTVLYRLADDNLTNPINNRLLIDAEYNRSFVYTQYTGYLRRDSDIAGFLFWLEVVGRFPFRDITGQNAMVCAFITSREYQERFSPIVTRFNSECGP